MRLMRRVKFILVLTHALNLLITSSKNMHEIHVLEVLALTHDSCNVIVYMIVMKNKISE